MLLAGVPIYLFTPAGSYLNIKVVTDGSGQAFFNLPAQPYKIRLDYLGKQYLSEAFSDEAYNVVVDEGRARVQIFVAGGSLAGVPIYVFSDSDKYLNISGQTDEAGTVLFQLPAGFYKFRANYQASQFWATGEVVAHSVNAIDLQTGGGTFSVTVRTDESTVLAGIKCYCSTAPGLT